MGRAGRDIVGQLLKDIRIKHKIDFVIAQAENVSHGKAMSVEHMNELRSYGVDFFTGGNHSYKRTDTQKLLQNDNSAVIGPANLPVSPGKGYRVVSINNKKIAIISLLGTIFPLREQEIASNPLVKIDELLNIEEIGSADIKIINFHGDWSSEKRVIGYYLDGKVNAVIGDHWHVPSGDAMTLPKGTAHITDVGMCGSLHSSLGVDLDVIIPRWREGIKTSNEIDNEKPWQFNAVLIKTSKVKNSIKPIRMTIS